MATHSLMLLGTHSSAGKSLLATAFCRILARKGYRVAPFKAQNMSNNAGVTPEGGEMGRAQLVQAEAAGIQPHTDMNPILLKPEGGRRSQVVLNGHAHGHIEANNWLAMKAILWNEARAAYARLAARYDVIVLEGAGSPAEINLKAGDIVNLRMARHAGAPCLLIGDIDRGGVFAALAGTMLLLDPDERAQVHGFLINRFRGDPALLGDGLRMLQERAFGVPTLGVIPYVPNLRIAEEDAVALERDVPLFAAPHDGALQIAIVQLPRISNFDEFDALALEAGVQVRYVQRVDELGRPDAIILPGSKATLADLAWLRESRFDAAILVAHRAGTEIVGVCGGYQLLGREVIDLEGVEGPAGRAAPALGLLPATTRFCATKHTHQARLRLADGDVLTGYEIHAGETTLAPGATAFGEIVERNGQPVRISDGAVSPDGRAWGTYLHGSFENDSFRRRWVQRLRARRQTTGTTANEEAGLPDVRALRQIEYERLADVVEAHVEMPAILRLMELSS